MFSTRLRNFFLLSTAGLPTTSIVSSYTTVLSYMKQYAARFHQPASFCSAQLDVRGGRYVLYAAALIASPVYLAFVREGSAGHGDGATDASRQPRTPNGAAAIPESIWRYRRSDGAVIAIQIFPTRLPTPPRRPDTAALPQS